ncbi:MAG: oligosaccharide flippase family protein [Candidatus Eremiobacteraeota bacterium]|nr:oligosaccharide flippase family protein [Candidatus Eremiobacteraeota bacterium]MBC5826074.1 oligosaccharide flippase family protein [Candidatus Eremiobacteraeota bacterium]
MASLPKDALRTFISGSLVTGISVATGIMVVRWLGPTGKGQLSGLELLRSTVSAFTGGLGAAVTYQFAKKGRTLTELALPLVQVIAGLSVIVWAGLSVWGAVRGISAAWIICMVAVPASLILALQTAFYTGLNRVRVLNYQTLGLAAGMMVAVVIAVQVLHKGTVGVIVAWALCLNAAAAVIGAQVLHPKYMKVAGSWHARLRELTSLGLRWTILGLMAFLTYRTDSILVAGLLGVASFGVYSVAVSAGELLFKISRSVATASVLKISSSPAPLAAELTAKAIRLSTVTVLGAAVGAFSIGPILIQQFYGPRFAGAGLPLRILIPGVVLFSSTGIFAQFFTYQLGRPVPTGAPGNRLLPWGSVAGRSDRSWFGSDSKIRPRGSGLGVNADLCD